MWSKTSQTYFIHELRTVYFIFGVHYIMLSKKNWTKQRIPIYPLACLSLTAHIKFLTCGRSQDFFIADFFPFPSKLETIHRRQQTSTEILSLKGKWFCQHWKEIGRTYWGKEKVGKGGQMKEVWRKWLVIFFNGKWERFSMFVGERVKWDESN